MFWIKNEENRYTPVNPSFAILKWDIRLYSLHGYVFLIRSTAGNVSLQKRKISYINCEYLITSFKKGLSLRIESG